MSELRTSILDFLWEAGSHACHQMPERSFFYKGEQFPVCARCTGTAVGQLLFLILGCRLKFKSIFLLFLLAPLGIDWLIQFLKVRESNNVRRFITGLLGGFAVFGLYRNILGLLISKYKQ